MFFGSWNALEPSIHNLKGTLSSFEVGVSMSPSPAKILRSCYPPQKRVDQTRRSFLVKRLLIEFVADRES